MVENAKRYINGTMPQRDVATSKGPNDPCNGYGGSTLTVGSV
jgi:hypothetical protein